MKEKFKLGDIIYNKRVELWHDTGQYGNWHQISKYEKFQIIKFYGIIERVVKINSRYNFRKM